MGTMKNCLDIVKALDDADIDDIEAAFKSYRDAGIEPGKAGEKAVNDVLYRVGEERAAAMKTIEEQAPDIHKKMMGDDPFAKDDAKPTAKQPEPTVEQPKVKGDPETRGQIFDLMNDGKRWTRDKVYEAKALLRKAGMIDHWDDLQIDQSSVADAVALLKTRAGRAGIVSDAGTGKPIYNLLDEIKKAGGIEASESPDIVSERGAQANRMRPGLFKKGGLSLDRLVERLVEDGYLTQEQVDKADADMPGGSHELAREMVRDALNGDAVHPSDVERAALYDYARRAAVDAGLPKDDATAGKVVDLDDLRGRMSEDEFESFVEKNAGLTDEEFDRAVAREISQRNIKEPQDGRSGNEDAGDFKLEQYDEAELASRADAERSAEAAARDQQVATENKAQADSQRDGFTLTGSDRAADANPNQGDIFGNSRRADETPSEKADREFIEQYYPPGTKLYSFPAMFFDPQQWKNLGTSLKPMVDAIRKAFPGQDSWLVKGFKDTAEFFAATPEAKRKRDAAGGVANSLFRSIMDTHGAKMRDLADRSKSEVFKRIIRDAYAVAGDTGARRLGLEHSVETQYNSRMNEMSDGFNALDKAIKEGKLDEKATWEQVANQVRNPASIRRGTAVGDAAFAIRKSLDDTLKYMRDAGLEVGEVRDGYYPREFDIEAVMRDPDSFKQALAAEYQKNGIPKQAADDMAADLANTMMIGGNSLFNVAGGKPAAPFIKSRVFGKDVEKGALAKFLISDPRQSISSYMQRAVRRTETARFINDAFKAVADDVKANGGSQTLKDMIKAATGQPPDSGHAWEAIRQKLVEDGVHGYAIGETVSFIQNIAGMNAATNSGAIARGASTVRALTAISMLEKATMSSLSEVFTPVFRSGNMKDIYHTLGATMRDLIDQAKGNKSALRELGEDLGILNAIASDQVMAHRWGGGDMATYKTSVLMDRAFKMTGLTQWTEATRMGALKVGQVFLRRMAARVSDGTAGKLDKNSLRELGIPEAKMDQFSKWLMATNDGHIDANALRNAPPEMAKLYGDALRRFDYDSIMRPNKATRPQWASTPLGGMIFQLQSYNYAFYENVLKRAWNQTKTGLTDSSYSMNDRVRMAGMPIASLALLPAAQLLVGELRDALFGDPERKKTTEQKVITALSRGVPVAPLDPMLNIISAAKYNRSATEVIAGPALGSVGKAIDAGVGLTSSRNSKNTNTAERSAAKNMYDVLLEPAAAIALANMFAHAPLPAKVGIAVARQAVGSGQVRDQFATAVAGEPTAKKQKQQK